MPVCICTCMSVNYKQPLSRLPKISVLQVQIYNSSPALGPLLEVYRPTQNTCGCPVMNIGIYILCLNNVYTCTCTSLIAISAVKGTNIHDTGQVF